MFDPGDEQPFVDDTVHPQQVITMLEKWLRELHCNTVAALELAFKPANGDVRESPSLIAALAERCAAVRAFDPVVSVTGAAALEALGVEVAIADGLEAVVAGVDAVAFMTSLPEFGELRSVLGPLPIGLMGRGVWTGGGWWFRTPMPGAWGSGSGSGEGTD